MRVVAVLSPDGSGNVTAPLAVAQAFAQSLASNASATLPGLAASYAPLAVTGLALQVSRLAATGRRYL